jgi:hypothetical protein
MSKRNENCLKGVRCPKCGHTDDFYIVGQSTFHTLDDGTEGHTDVEWDDQSSCRCGNSNCEFVGDLADFQKLTDSEKERLTEQLIQDCYNDQGFMLNILQGYVEQNYDLASYQDYFQDIDEEDEE